MGSLIAETGTPYVPSTPVQIGTAGHHHSVPEAGAWTMLIAMFMAVVVLGAAVLMFAVRQRTRLLTRRRVRRMAEAVAADHADTTPNHIPARAHHTRHVRPPSSERVT